MKHISIKDLFPALYNYIPGWIRGTYYCITGATGSGKSKFEDLKGSFFAE